VAAKQGRPTDAQYTVLSSTRIGTITAAAAEAACRTLTITMASCTAIFLEWLPTVSLYTPSACAWMRTFLKHATPLRSLVRLLPEADTRAAMPSAFSALPLNAICSRMQHTRVRQIPTHRFSV
jgi:hypothetical protein